MALSVHERAEEAGITSKGMAKQLLRYLDDKMTQQAPEQYLVPVSSYVDPDLWRREVDEIFKRKPQVVAFSAEIREPGDYKALDIMGVNLLVTRDDSGVAHVLLNACRHRGVAVVEHGGGSTQRFSCPYHGWTYDNAGKLGHG